jgi:hypothetical protein
MTGVSGLGVSMRQGILRFLRFTQIFFGWNLRKSEKSEDAIAYLCKAQARAIA